MSSFFTVPGAQKKRKRATAPDVPKKRIAAAASSKQTPSSIKKSTRTKETPSSSLSRNSSKGKAVSRPPEPSSRSRNRREEEDDDDDDEVSESGSDLEEQDDDELALRDGSEDDSDLESVGDGRDEAETAAERRLRLAERYLENVRREVGGGGDAEGDDRDGDIYAFDAEEIDRDLIAERLQEDVAEAKGRVYRQLADELRFERAGHCLFRWNAKNVNAVAVCAPYAYTVSSDTYLTKWRLQDRPEEQRQQRAEARRKWEEEKAKKRRGKRGKKAAAKKSVDFAEEAVDDVPSRKRPQRVLFRRGNPSRRRDRTYQEGHVGAILAVAASQDGKFVATGGADRRLIVWDAATLKPLRVFTHHRDAVTGLVFRRGTNQLYSCSRDRTIKIWSLDELAYVQTLFGHQDDVVDIDALALEKCISVGTRDRTARLWKVVEETQLVFRGGGSGGRASSSSDKKAAVAVVDVNSQAHEGSMDRVAMLDDELFVTGSDNGALALWSTQKKKPLFVVPRAHGLEPVLTGREDYDRALSSETAQRDNPPPPPQPRWITALRTVPYTDVVFSGSWDGCVRVWRLSKDKRKLEALCTMGDSSDEKKSQHSFSSSSSSSPSSPASFSIPGVVNDIAVFERGERGKDGLSVVVAVGQEHRLGRWGRVPGARNGAVVFEIEKAAVDGVNGTLNGVNGHLTNGAAHEEASDDER